MPLLCPRLPAGLSPSERRHASWFFRFAGIGLAALATASTAALAFFFVEIVFPDMRSGSGPLVGAAFVPEWPGKHHRSAYWIACFDVAGQMVCAPTGSEPRPGVGEVRWSRDRIHGGVLNARISSSP